MTSQPCSETAIYKRFWPGQPPDFICLEHANDTAKIAKAIDCNILMRPITVADLIAIDSTLEIPKCACHEGHPQEINMVGYEKQTV
jgi:hypothetical protein